MKKTIKKILPKFIWNLLWQVKLFCMRHNPMYAAKVTFETNTGRKMNLKDPKDLNEKINWLKFYGDTREWPRMADKWAVREYVKERGLGDLLIKTYGRWDDAKDIDFDSLPTPCVIKTNHGSGMNLFLKTKPSKDEIPALRKKLNKWIHTPFCDQFGEPHYGKIKPCIMAEKMLFGDNALSSSLIDYKVFSFDGKPALIWACCNRTFNHVEVAAYDLQWNFHPEYSIFNKHYSRGEMTGKLPKPICLDAMIEAASILSKGHPQVRVDFYEVNGKLYFGEMTMSSQGGYMSFFTHETLLWLGDMCKLPIDK